MFLLHIDRWQVRLWHDSLLIDERHRRVKVHIVVILGRRGRGPDRHVTTRLVNVHLMTMEGGVNSLASTDSLLLCLVKAHLTTRTIIKTHCGLMIDHCFPPWQPLQELLSWCPLFKSSHCITLEDQETQISNLQVPGARPTNDISIKFEIRPNFAVLCF